MQWHLLVLIENLHPDERIEDHGLENSFRIVVTREIKNFLPSKIEDESHDKLVDRLPDDHLPHGTSNQR